MAQKNGKSLNRVILDMIYRYSGFKKKKGKSLSVSLRKLAGTWSEKDSSEFLESIRSCEQIDEEMWK